MQLPPDRAAAILPHAAAWWIGRYTMRCEQYVAKARDDKLPITERRMWRQLAREQAAAARDEYRRLT